MNLCRIRALLIDDEVLARLALRQALAPHRDIEIVGECGSAPEALQAINALAPDLLFLDIHMPGMDGFKLLRALSSDTLPLVVFATAYGDYALDAFDSGAVDYVLKPIDQERFDMAVERVKNRRRVLDEKLRPETGSGSSCVQRVSVRVGGHIRVVQISDLDWVGAAGNYVELHVGNAVMLHRESLRNFLGILDPTRFLRVHRGTVVNVERIREVRPLSNGNAEVVLHDGTLLNMSRRFRTDALRILGIR